MPSDQDVESTISAIKDAVQSGDMCLGYAAKKSVDDWAAIFEEASKKLGVEMVKIGPSTAFPTVESYINGICEAFNIKAKRGLIVFADGTANRRVDWANKVQEINDAIEAIHKEHPRVMFINAMGYNDAYSEPLKINVQQPRP